MKSFITWSACSEMQLFPCCAWIFGNLYMQVGKSIFMWPPETGFTWYMDMSEDSEGAVGGKKTVKKRNPGYSRSARYWQAAAAATMQEEAALTSCPLKIKADFKFICVYELRPLGCDLSTVFNVHIQNISKTITCVQTLLWSYHHKRH